MSVVFFMSIHHKQIRKIFRWGLVVLLVMAGIGWGSVRAYRELTRAETDNLPLTTRVEPQPFTLTIPAKGELQAVESTAVVVPNVPIDGPPLRIATIVSEGVFVKKGDVLIEFDPTELQLLVRDNRAVLASTNQKINKGEITASIEKQDLVKEQKIAELELQKLKEFQPKDAEIFTRRQIVEAEIDRAYTEKRIEFAGVRLQLKDKIYSLEEAILMLERQQAETKINDVEKSITSLKLVSPVSGIVVYPDPSMMWGGPLQPGRVVYLGMQLCTVVNPEQMEAKCYVLEKDAGELKSEQPVTVTLDAYPDWHYAGKIKNIHKLARAIERDSPVKYFQVVVGLDQTDQVVMKPGVKLKAQIQAGELKNAIIVPRSALIKRGADFLVYIESQAGKFELAPVKLGQGDQVKVVVTEGLKPGQLIALNPPDIKYRSDSKPVAKT